VLRTHIAAKVLPTVAVTTAHALATALLTVTSLTFLGVGVQPPAPTWGGVLASDLGYLAQQPWAPVLPGVLIMITVGALNLLADAVRDSGAADSPADRPDRPDRAGRAGRTGRTGRDRDRGKGSVRGTGTGRAGTPKTVGAAGSPDARERRTDEPIGV
jgi:peptide/nickel transport system permease protein